MAALVSGLPVLADRLAVVETLGRLKVGRLQYLDDSVTPCPSVGAVRAILDQTLRSASVRYAQWARAAFIVAAAPARPPYLPWTRPWPWHSAAAVRFGRHWRVVTLGDARGTPCRGRRRQERCRGAAIAEPNFPNPGACFH